MGTPGLWSVAIFLPLFPLSVIFNALFARVGNAPMRAIILLAWPQVGLVLFGILPPGRVAGGVVALAVLGSLLYAFRAIALRDVDRWTGYIATSAWALLWPALAHHAAIDTLRLYALGFSVPLALLVLVADALKRRFGAAYAGLYGGTVRMLPRLAGATALVVLAAVAVPLFPGFFALVAVMVTTIPEQPWLAVCVGLTWLLWTWGGIRLLQGLIVGPGEAVAPVADLSRVEFGFYVLTLALLIAGALRLPGVTA